MHAPSVNRLLRLAVRSGRPTAVILAGHNGAGKSTLWYDRLAPILRMPLVNADRLTAAILPLADGETGNLPEWAQDIRDGDERWQRLSQLGVRAFKDIITGERIPFAFETVFSHWRRRPGGGHESKADDILALQRAGYFVVLVFVGLSHVSLSIGRVATRKRAGGHGVPLLKLLTRFGRTQAAVASAAPLADMTLMFDNSRSEANAFSLVHAQRGDDILFDCRDERYQVRQALRSIANLWLPRVVASSVAG